MRRFLSLGCSAAAFSRGVRGALTGGRRDGAQLRLTVPVDQLFPLRRVWRAHRDPHAQPRFRREALARALLAMTARAAGLRPLLGVHVGRTRQLLAAMLAGPVIMAPVVENGRRGYRFSGKLRLSGLLTGEGLGTRSPVVAPTGFEPVSWP